VKHSYKQLVKFGLIEDGEYAVRVRGSKKKKQFRVFILHLPADPKERRRIIEDVDAQKSLAWLKKEGQI